MDLKLLDTKTPAENGADLHLRHPVMGHLLYNTKAKNVDANGKLTTDAEGDAKPIIVMVRGTESPSVRARLKEVNADDLLRRKISKALDVGEDFAHSLVIGFKNLTIDGRDLSDSDEDKRIFFAQSDDLMKQVLTFAEEKTNFFKSASAD